MIEKYERQIEQLEFIIQECFKNFYTNKCNISSKLGNAFVCVLGGTPNTKEKLYWNGNINWINSGEVNKLRICHPSKTITELGLRNSATKLLPKKTTVIAITGGTLGQISLLEIDSCANQSVVGILSSKHISHIFTYPLLHFQIAELVQHKTGGAQPHINKANIESLNILLPTKEEYLEYERVAKPLFDLQSNLVIKNEDLKNIKHSLLKKYFG